jgi:hypothetical protein
MPFASASAGHEPLVRFTLGLREAVALDFRPIDSAKSSIRAVAGSFCFDTRRSVFTRPYR